MILHPRFRTLEGFADGALGGRRRGRVASHLRECARCRRRVLEIRELGETARTDPGPRLPPNGFGEVVDRAEAGREVLLPVSGVGAPDVSDTGSWAAAPAPWLRVAGLVAVFAAAAAYFLVSTEEAEAGHSELRFDPTRPRPGAEVRVTYRPAPRLGGRERLVLRARFRGRHDGADRPIPAREVGDLRRGEDGLFHGSFRLPDAAVFAAFAVEDTAGERIDANRGRLWTLLAHDERGRPSPAALRRQVDDLQGRNWELAHQTARRMTELYPHDPSSWVFRRSFDAAVVPAASADSLRRFYAAVFQRLDRRLRADSAVLPREAADMWYLAWTVMGAPLERGDEPDSAGTAMAFWRERVLAAPPHDERTLLVQHTYATVEHYRDPAALSRALEELWERSSVPDLRLARYGLEAARRADDHAALRRWWLRFAEVHPRPELPVGAALAELDRYREEGIRWLERELERLETAGDRFRALDETRAEHARQVAARRGRALVTLAEALVAEGRTDEATQHLVAAASAPWDPDLLRRSADLRVALGDTTAALEAYARAAADPVAPTDFADTVRRRTGGRFDPRSWARRVDRARPEVLRAIHAGLEDGPPVDREVRLAGLEGGDRTLASLTGGRVAVITFWSRRCGPSLQQLPSLPDFASELDRRGIAYLAVTGERPSEELRAFLSRRNVSDLPAWTDSDGELGRALNQWSTPEHFLLDREGRIRLVKAGSLEGVLRAAEVVRRGDRAARGDGIRRPG